MYNAILIGSQAAKFHLPHFRCPKDWDIIMWDDEFRSWVKLNYENITQLRKSNICSNKYLCKMADGAQLEVSLAKSEYDTSSKTIMECRTTGVVAAPYGITCGIPSLEMLTAIKHSHITQDIHWWKNISDYCEFKRVLNVKNFSELSLTEKEMRCYEQRKLEASVRSKSRKVDLNMSNDAFFSKSQNALGRAYVHDDIHAATCFYDKPLYLRCKRDVSLAKIDRDLFFRLNYTDRVKMVQEEAFAIALERVIIPQNQSQSVSEDVIANAYRYAIRRISTTLTSGWFRDFAIENHIDVLDYNGYNFVSKFWDAVSQGKVRSNK